jgi:hypothetical protein
MSSIVTSRWKFSDSFWVNIDLPIGGRTKKPTIVKTAKKISTPTAIFFKTDLFMILEKFMALPLLLISSFMHFMLFFALRVLIFSSQPLN